MNRLNRLERALYLLASIMFLSSAVITIVDYLKLGETEPRSAINLIFSIVVLLLGFVFFKLGTRRSKR